MIHSPLREGATWDRSQVAPRPALVGGFEGCQVIPQFLDRGFRADFAPIALEIPQYALPTFRGQVEAGFRDFGHDELNRVHDSCSLMVSGRTSARHYKCRSGGAIVKWISG